MALLRAVQRVFSMGLSIIGFHIKVSVFLPMLNYRAPSRFLGEFTEIGRQMVVHELLLGQCHDGLFAIIAVSCMQLCLM